jgi:hypothetical protein
VGALSPMKIVLLVFDEYFFFSAVAVKIKENYQSPQALKL